MANYLIALSIGPVQDFIIAAHKTRDLWFGSHLLSEISKAAAKSLKTQGADLIFPAPENPDEDLKPSEDQDSFNVANKLLVKFSTDHPEKPRKIVEKAKQAACARWDELAQTALEKLGEHNIYPEVWKAQVGDVLELYGAWVKQGNDYSQARRDVEKLLAARKATRNFLPATHTPEITGGLPKSSLDAARETVLRKKLNIRARHLLNLSANEHLDCPGVVKRVGGKNESFAAITRIALETWFSKLLKDRDEEANKALGDIDKSYRSLKSKQMATAVPDYEILPFDCGLLFPERIDALHREINGDPSKNLPGLKDLEGFQPIDDELAAIVQARERLYKKYNPPTPYFAVLVADGDRMGKVLDETCKGLPKEKAINKHQAISKQLAAFAENAKTIVKKHRGAPVYTGGDDVLALLPVHKAVQCADKLRQDFSAKLDGKATLSVGLAITHVTTPFTLAMGLGRKAEKLAKQSRNALGIILEVRSGAELRVCGQWNSDLVDNLQAWQDAYAADKLPGKLPYNLREAVDCMAWAKTSKKYQKDYPAIVAQEVERVLSKKRAAGETMSEPMRARIVSAIERNPDETVKQLRLARWLAGKLERGA